MARNYRGRGEILVSGRGPAHRKNFRVILTALTSYANSFTRNQSAIVAFAVGKRFRAGGGVHVVGAHVSEQCTHFEYAAAETLA